LILKRIWKWARRVYDSLYCENEVFSMNDILQLINKNPEIALINQDVQQSTMYKNKRMISKLILSLNILQ